MPLKAGDTFFIPSTGGWANPAGSHLFVCLTDPDEKGNVITVAINTFRTGSDSNCVLNPADHKFVTRKSCMAYDKANKMSAKVTENQIAIGHYNTSDAVSPALLSRIRKGLIASDDTPEFIKTDYKKAITWLAQQANSKRGGKA